MADVPDIDQVEEECASLCLEYLERCRAEGLSVVTFCVYVGDIRQERAVSRSGREGVIELLELALSRTGESTKGKGET